MLSQPAGKGAAQDGRAGRVEGGLLKCRAAHSTAALPGSCAQRPVAMGRVARCKGPLLLPLVAYIPCHWCSLHARQGRSSLHARPGARPVVAHSQRAAKNWSGSRCANMGAPSSGPWNQYSSWMAAMSMAVVLRMLRSLQPGARAGQEGCEEARTRVVPWCQHCLARLGAC